MGRAQGRRPRQSRDRHHGPLRGASRGGRERGALMVKNRRISAEQEEELRRLTLEALADVDAGRVIDHQTVQTWVDNLDSHLKNEVSEPE
ncbi:hypothetical protein EJ076_17950 [Mesorhizobium sp. M7D.F.Ca.US.005.01.1.1]|nr:hypothetical protein [Mesorhizobium sp. M7D.F.Ca.US.005.01.1.1]AZO42845.1 hypothetical protein EJ076_17950 [Mesorhizobium sp. M7D.F.Ca.US.005.01.1.1]